jgi:hypothetical protein
MPRAIVSAAKAVKPSTVIISDSDKAEIIKMAKKITFPTLRRWSMENVQTRNVAERLNELSAKDYTIFAVNQSQAIGGTYEVIYFIDKPVEDVYPA